MNTWTDIFHWSCSSQTLIMTELRGFSADIPSVAEAKENHLVWKLYSREHISVTRVFSNRFMISMGGPRREVNSLPHHETPYWHWTHSVLYTIHHRSASHSPTLRSSFLQLLHGPWPKVKQRRVSHSATSFDIHHRYLKSSWLLCLRLS